MACRRSGKFSIGVVVVGAARPAVVVWGSSGGLDACSAELLLKVSDGNMKFSEVLQGDDDLGVGVSAVCSECAVVCVRAATEAQSLAVAVAKFAMASTVSFW